MAWQSDDEKSIGKDATIASLALGTERDIRFKHKRTGEKSAVRMKSGSLLVMKGITQTSWLHNIPKSEEIKTPHINLTFRTMEIGTQISTRSRAVTLRTGLTNQP